MPSKEQNSEMINRMEQRKKRIARLKKMLIFTLIVFLLIPTIFCTILFFRMNNLEKQIKILSQKKSDIDVAVMAGGGNMKEVHAANLVQRDNKGSSVIGDNLGNIIDFVEDNNIENDLEKEEDVKGYVEQYSDDNVINSNSTGDNTKKVYFTFDDGPSEITPQVLDILAEHNIYATFFVIGKTDEHSKAMYKRIVDEGHTLAMHSYSHRYSDLYKSVKNFIKDTEKLSNLLYETTGVKVNIYRFPGGSSNIVSKVPMSEFIKYLNTEGYVYFDWNVSNGDATGAKLSKNQLVSNVIKDVKKFSQSIILMHDSTGKSSTVESLPMLIKELNKLEVSILPLDENVKPIQHLKADEVQ